RPAARVMPAAEGAVKASPGPAFDIGTRPPVLRPIRKRLQLREGCPMPGFRTLDDVDLANRRVLLRADLNVPVADGKVTDATRLERIVPTIRDITKVGGKAILLSHFGRPKGKVDPAFSLETVIPALVEVVGHPVGFIATDWTDTTAA